LGAVEKFFGQGWFSPLEKIGPYAYGDFSHKETMQEKTHFFFSDPVQARLV